MAATEARTRRAHPFMLWTPDAQALNLLGDKWTLLIVRELASGALRRHELQRRLGISTEMLGSRIAAMEDDGLLVKHSLSTGRLQVEYQLTDRGRDAVPVIAELARFGLRHTWSAPTPAQHVDMRAIFELLPILMAGTALAAGVEDKLVLLGAGEEGDLLAPSVAVRFQAGGPPQLERRPPTGLPIMALLAGTPATWVKVLTSKTMRGLRVSGSEQAIADVIATLRGEPT